MKSKKKKKTAPQIVAIENTIYNTAVADGMPSALAKLIVAQSKLETGDYTSNFFLNYNNCFGYSCVPGGQWQSGCGTLADNGISIAAYSSIENSTHEITHWIRRRQAEGKFPADLNEITTADQYSLLLKNAGYYGASLADYTAGVLYWFNRLPPLAVAVIGTSTLIVGALVAYLFRKDLFS